MIRHPAITAVVTWMLAGCTAQPADDARAHAAGTRVMLVDSLHYGDGLIDGLLRRVVVARGARQDTVPDVLVADAPVVGPDGFVYGIRAEEERAVGLFAYDVDTRRVRTLPTPEGWWDATAPRLAPDGRHVAYLAGNPDGTGYAAVAALPGGQVLYRGPRSELLPTDAGVDEITWPTARRFEIRVYLGGTAVGIQRVRGSVDPLVVEVDTIADVPVQREGTPR